MTEAPQRLGHEGVPLWQRDAAHPDPLALVAAARAEAFARAEGDLYPGLRAPVPAGYAAWLAQAVAALAGEAVFLRATFAVASDDPAALAPIQRIPHFDDASEGVIAAVHYLCAAPHGGTSFYRHRATGFERITPERVSVWRQALARDGQAHGLPPKAYHEGDSAAFARIGGAALAFNRLIAYPANCLHAGDVAGSWQAAGTTPRLTITSLLRLA